MRSHVIQTSFLSGVLSPEASARVDSDAYQQGLLVGVNVVPRPLGGLKRRPGLEYLATLPNILTFLTPTGATAPRGGTVGNAYDESDATLLTTTTNVSTIDPYVVVRYDLGAATSVLFADVLELVATGNESTQFRIQYSTDDAAWTNLGDALEQVDTTKRSYRRGGTAVSARYWRVAKVGGTDMGANTVSLAGFNVYSESAGASEVKLVRFELDAGTEELCVLTDRSLTLFENGALVFRAPAPYLSSELAEVDAAQNQDSLVLVHGDHAPRFVLFELGTVYCDKIVFDQVPQYDFNDDLSPTPVSEVQVITFGAGWRQGNTFQIDLEGARTSAITFAGDGTAAAQAATAGNIAREVQKLYTVPGFTGVSCARTGALAYTVTFAGASAKDYDLMSAVPLSAPGSGGDIDVAGSADGTSRTEDAWSTTRGFPRTVTFFENRMYFGSTPSLPGAIMGSKVNQILDFDTAEALDDEGIFVILSGQQLNAIQALFSSRALQVFSTGTEFRYAKQAGVPITPVDAPAAQTHNGAAKVRPVNIDGTTIYVQRTRKAIRDFRYDYEEDAYTSLGISALAPHLIDDVQGLASWNGSSTDEISLALVVNGNGTMAVLNSQREASVRAWVQWTTPGLFKAAAGLREDIYVAVRRTINGVERLFLERTDDDFYLDAAVRGATVSTINVSGVSYAYSGTGSFYYRYVDTATAHGRTAGDQVTIEGVVASGSYDVDGTWTVQEVVSATRLRLKSISVAPTGSYVSGGTLSAGSTDVVTGLGHLNGEECRVRADGYTLANVTPSAGSATIERESSFIEVGLDWRPVITPMPFNQMTPNGANFMRTRRIIKVRVRVHETLGLLVNGQVIPDLKFDVGNFGDLPDPYTGIRSIEEMLTWDDDEDKLVTFSQVDPQPMTLLGIDVEMDGSD